MLKNEFLQIPIMLLTATAPPEVQSELISIVWNTCISKGNIDRQNIYFQCVVVESGDSKDLPHMSLRNKCAIIYTDFIRHIGPIMSKLKELELIQLHTMAKWTQRHKLRAI